MLLLPALHHCQYSEVGHCVDFFVVGIFAIARVQVHVSIFAGDSLDAQIIICKFRAVTCCVQFFIEVKWETAIVAMSGPIKKARIWGLL